MQKNSVAASDRRTGVYGTAIYGHTRCAHSTTGYGSAGGAGVGTIKIVIREKVCGSI